MLRTRGLSPTFAKRMVVELRDHLECKTREYVEDGHSEEVAARLAQERLGHNDVILEHALSDPGALALPHRHPFLTFFAAPIVAVGFALAMYISIAPPSGDVTTRVLGLEVTDPRFYVFARALYFCAGYLLWFFGAIAVCAVAHRYRCAIKWSLLGCLTLAGMGSLLFVYMKIPVSATDMEIVAYGTDLASRVPRIILPLVTFALFAVYVRTTTHVRTGANATTP